MIKFALLFVWEFNVMAQTDIFVSRNFFVTDINELEKIKAVKIKRIDNFNLISQPEGMLENFDLSKPSEILIQIKNEFPFDEAIVSLSADIKKKDIISSSIVVEGEEFSFGNFSFGSSKSFSKKNRIGNIDVDVVKFNKKIKDFDLRIKLYNNSGEKTKIKLINVVLTDSEKKLNGLGKIKNNKIKLNVPKISQMVQQVNYNQDICSPTSLTMVLNYYGIKIDTITAASNVIDTSENIYGNWIFNTIFASSKGVYSFVSRLNSYEELYFYLSRGIPVVASITFGPGELGKSPIKKTKGHLVVIKGIDENGDIIVNDPAGKNNDFVEVVYDSKEFAKAWFKNKYGTSYIIIDDIYKLISPSFPYSEIYSKDKEKLTQITPDENVFFVKKSDFGVLAEAFEQKIYKSDKKLSPYGGYMSDYRFSLPQVFNAVVKEKSADVYGANKKKFLSLSMGTRFYAISEADGFYFGFLSGVLFYVKKEDVFLNDDLKKLNSGEKVVELSKKFMETQYDWGGRSFNGIDCSGLTSVVYKTLGMEIPRNANDQYISAKKLKSFAELKKGDLIFSTKENSNFIDHVMIYSGDGKIIEATKDSNNVREILFEEKFGEKIENIEPGQKIKGKKIYFGSFLKEEKSNKRRKK